MKFRSITET